MTKPKPTATVEDLGTIEIQVGWSWRKVVDGAREKLRSQGFPQPIRPTKDLEDLGSIEAIEALSGIALANLTVRHQAWYSYTTVEFAYSHAALKALEEILEIKLGERMHQVVAGVEGRAPIKDVQRALAIAGDDGLKAWFRKKVELEQQDRLLEGTVKGLEIRCRALESEQIRRAMAQKIEAVR